jgi:hypothetical protein
MIKYNAGYTRDPVSPEQRAQYTEVVEKLSNLDLLEDTIELSAGDDYDGVFSRHGQVVYETLRAELYHRLEKIKFLPEDSGDE